MDIPLNAEVFCSDGVCGISAYLVMHPETKEITHVVVKESHAPHHQHLIPTKWITETTPRHIELRCTQNELAHADSFIATRFVKVEASESAGFGYMYAWP